VQDAEPGLECSSSAHHPTSHSTKPRNNVPSSLCDELKSAASFLCHPCHATISAVLCPWDTGRKRLQDLRNVPSYKSLSYSVFIKLFLCTMAHTGYRKNPERVATDLVVPSPSDLGWNVLLLHRRGAARLGEAGDRDTLAQDHLAGKCQDGTLTRKCLTTETLPKEIRAPGGTKEAGFLPSSHRLPFIHSGGDLMGRCCWKWGTLSLLGGLFSHPKQQTRLRLLCWLTCPWHLS
jgi:hypothetical protein